MKRYEALIILHNPPSEDDVKIAVDNISDKITKAGGEVETVQKMDRKAFSRVASKKSTSGFYTNFIFSAPMKEIPALTSTLSGMDEVFRILLADAPTVPPPVPSTAAA